ncbi:partial Elongation factor Ts, partial [Candidatus Brocadiaceae bacterium]
DFVAKSDDFVKFAQLVLDTVEKSQVTTVEELINTSVEVKNGIEETMGKVGEKTEISRFTRVSSEDGIIVDYIHPGSRLGVLIQLSQVPAEHAAAFYTCGRDLAMQVAAMNPVSVSRDEVPQATIDSELEIYKELARKEGKPENMLEKISQGRLNKYFQETCLLEQVYTKDNSLTVKEYVAQVNKASGTNATVVKFTRFQLGDSSK